MRASLIALIIIVSGCTHATEFVHERPDDRGVAPVLTHSLRIAVASSLETDERLERRFQDELRRVPTIALYDPRVAPVSDYTVELHVRSRAMSRGTNFLICWPGFIVFAPAWHGLEWPYRVNTVVRITRPDGSELTPVERSDFYMAYSTSNAYGTGAGLGWIPFLYSVPAFVTGIVASFVPESRMLDEEFVLREGDDWARRVATSVLRAIAADGEPPGSARAQDVPRDQ